MAPCQIDPSANMRKLSITYAASPLLVRARSGPFPFGPVPVRARSFWPALLWPAWANSWPTRLGLPSLSKRECFA